MCDLWLDEKRRAWFDNNVWNVFGRPQGGPKAESQDETSIPLGIKPN
ncbi:hypothetical protein GCM10011369_06120 [Neiella marina]|uniref:Uncharacterized protein n=1 Tax=Neiella marina TaxID=508461 RepID=A0A8J2U2I7_9GAMM|nr:hypothetical protein GCM10011369_06120 [Neiella marina]